MIRNLKEIWDADDRDGEIIGYAATAEEARLLVSKYRAERGNDEDFEIVGTGVCHPTKPNSWIVA